MLVRVMGTVLEIDDDADVLVEVGIIPMRWIADGDPDGNKFSLEVEVIERDGNRIVVRPIGLPALEGS